MTEINNDKTIDAKRRHEPERFAQLAAAVDLYEGTEGYLVVADLPGVPAEAVQVELEHNELRIYGKRQAHALAKSLARGSGAAELRRTIRLPEDIDPTGVKAEVKAGVLQLQIPKSAHLRPRRIPVQAT